jgi:hypothetical protein
LNRPRSASAPENARDRWVIIHEHVSVPVDLDTGKPDLTSKP